MTHDQFLTSMALNVAMDRVESAGKGRTAYYTELIAEWKAAYRDFKSQPWDKTFPSLGTKPGSDEGAEEEGENEPINP